MIRIGKQNVVETKANVPYHKMFWVLKSDVAIYRDYAYYCIEWFDVIPGRDRKGQQSVGYISSKTRE